jgi:hypothetical protein
MNNNNKKNYYLCLGRALNFSEPTFLHELNRKKHFGLSRVCAQNGAMGTRQESRGLEMWLRSRGLA